MKKTILTSVLIMLSCAAFAAVDTSTIDNATTIDNAKTAYQTAANKVIETYNGKIDEKEITSAKEQVTENINAVTEEAKNGTLSETIDKAEKSGGGDGVLSEEDSKAKIAELQKNADAMKEREQSLANRLVSGASMGAMGIGGMQLASAAAEQSADAAAEQDMSAYLATFKCDYGQGMTINGGDLNITLPGANTLLPLYNEYTTLAADLKVRKEALGMTPGIESEVILDAATSGLYDNVGTGVTDGAFASVSRALMNTTGADAAEWNAQKAETAQQLKTGAITAGAGALVGIVGNVLINEVGDKTKEMSDEIIAKYDAKRQAIREELKPVENASKNEVIQNPPVSEIGKEDTPQDQVEKSEAQKACEEQGGKWSQNTCTCPDSGKWNSITNNCDATKVHGVVVSDPEPGTENEKPIVTIYSDSMFDSGQTTIKDTAKLDETITKLKKEIGTETAFEIVLVAHTDKDKIIQSSSLCTDQKICTNQQLSEERANAVQKYIKEKWSDMPKSAKITIKAVGEQCAKGTTKEEKALDRKVDFYVFFAGENINDMNICSKNNQ